MSVVCKQELEPELGHMAAPKNVSDLNLSRLVRQIALHCNLAAVIHVKSIYNKGDPYASNWLERLRAIKRLKTKVLKELKEEKDASGLVNDFTGNLVFFLPASNARLRSFCIEHCHYSQKYFCLFPFFYFQVMCRI